MYGILLGISRELANIKQIMAEEGETAASLHQLEPIQLGLTEKLYIFNFECNLPIQENIKSSMKSSQLILLAMLGPVDDGDSLGVPDGDDYKALVEMEDFQSQVIYHNFLQIKISTYK